MQSKLIKNGFIKSAVLATLLVSLAWASGCKVEVMQTREQKEQADASKNAQLAVSKATTELPTPTTDNAAQVIATCGPAASDSIVTVDERGVSGAMRKLVYSNGREITLDFIPLQTSSGNGHAAASSNTVWRFNQARVENQTLLTAANIRVYLPCAANALAKEF
jgi:hypothetical protein